MVDYETYIGNEFRQNDVITPALVDRYRAVIGNEGHAADLPFGLHWCLCLPKAPMADLGIDGHPKTGGFLPKSKLPRRMWASSEVHFLKPLITNRTIERVSTIQSVKAKSGRSGELLFVNVEHATKIDGQDSIREAQTIVYREASTAKSEFPNASDHDLSDWEYTESITPNETLLFRFSALTFNTHRIHYDLPFATGDEGYPALVVHGPLMASLLLRFATQILKNKSIRSFKFRGLSPAYCNEVLSLAANQNENGLELAIIGSDGRSVMSAEVLSGQ